MNEMKNIIFLDVDGVLNNDSSKEELCKQNLHVLKQLIDSIPNVILVLISEWRNNQASLNLLKNIFVRFDIPIWKEVTPTFDLTGRNVREKEILSYVLLHKIKPHNMLIIDDINSYEVLLSNLIKTDYRKGLTINEIDRALEVLKKQKIIYAIQLVILDKRRHPTKYKKLKYYILN